LGKLVDDDVADILDGGVLSCKPQIASEKARDFATKALNDHKGETSTECRMAILEAALLEEFQGDFPLIRTNLIKIWRYCFNFLSRVGAQGSYTTGAGDPLLLREVLNACDEFQKENAGRTEDLPELPKKHVLRRWRRAMLKEFGGTTKNDFLWQGI
jgi:hypothetical protein